MDISLATLRWQRGLILVVLVASCTVVWPSGIDNFALPQATTVVLFAVCALWVTAVRWSWWRRVVVPRSPAVLAAGVFAIGMVLTTLTSTSRLQSVVGQHSQYSGMALYLACVVLFLATVRGFDAATVPLVLRAFVVAMCAVVLYGLVQVLGIDPIHWHVKAQITSTLSNPDFLAGWLSIAFGPCAVVAAMRSQPKAWRVAAGLTMLGGIVVVQQTGTFQGPVATAAGLAVAVAGVVWVRRSSMPWLTTRKIVLAVGLLVVVVAGGLAVGHRYVRRSIDQGLYDRRAYWSAAVHIFEDHPVVGTGPDTFHDQFLQRRPIGHVGKNGGAAHDVPLDLLANGGLVVALPYLAFLVLVAAALVRAIRRSAGDGRLVAVGVAAAWVGYLVQSLVSIDKPPLALAHWVVAGAAVALATTAEPWVLRLPGALDGRRQLHRGPSWFVPAGVATLVALAAVAPLTRPERADAAVSAAVHEMNHGEVAAAIRDVEHGRNLAPWEADHTYYAALIYRTAKVAPEYIEAAEKGARLKPGDASFSAFAAQAHTDVGDADGSARWWAETVRRDPWGTTSLREAALAAADRKDRAAIVLAVAHMKRISLVSGWALDGKALAIYGDKAGARAAYEEAIRLDPGNLGLKKALRKLSA